MSERCIAHGPRFNKITIGCTPVRQGRVAVSADIKEMFLRVKIREEDRDSLRFLWRNNMHENPQEYRMTSLIFGAASSFLVLRSTSKIATPQNLNLSTRRRAKRYD
ncbi:hypothetical protein EVAR_89139_1 [Eumeta japonica]|uniref:Reverse transcriptase domain-containing protein n=1 Tax=Eumeta variegata TaxID=151549 RepID=A0A4C1ZS46_EUMVA|nr:hypothetical protein EVAR_89139_1 [Eumeta japonica]